MMPEEIVSPARLPRPFFISPFSIFNLPKARGSSPDAREL